MTYKLVVIGSSLGGLRALRSVLGALAKTFPLPIVIVQHREHGVDDTLSALLQDKCALSVDEAQDKTVLRAGQVFLAPADYHVLVDGGHLALDIAAPVNFARPSIDVLFESAADAYHERVIGVILTGSSADGAQGLAAIKQRGGFAIVQDPATAYASAMPAAALAATAVDKVLPLEEIGPFLAIEASK